MPGHGLTDVPGIAAGDAGGEAVSASDFTYAARSQIDVGSKMGLPGRHAVRAALCDRRIDLIDPSTVAPWPDISAGPCRRRR